MWTLEGSPDLFFKMPPGAKVEMASIAKGEWEHALREHCDCVKCRQRDDRMFDIPILGEKNAFSK